MKFEQLEISTRIKKALSDIEYNELSPIQEQAIPQILDKHDILGCAQTGTGKTAAFMLPIIHNIITSGTRFKIRALILTPTRELAIQIHENTMKYSKYTNIRSLAIFGGVKEGHQKQKLSQGIDILIATPGRLLDFMNQRVISLSNIDYLVLDEADRMLDMGFVKDVNRIIESVPKKRQTLLFSATMPESIKELCDKILVNPISISVTPPSTTVDKIKQTVYMVEKANKLALLADIIKKENMFSVLVFSRTKYGADKIAKGLKSNNISVDVIHGNKSQNSRQNALKAFKSNKIQVLVATDIAARGIDIDYLSNVINYDLPETPETYVHRIGRTARAGREGSATSFCSSEEFGLLTSIKKECKIDIMEVSHKYEIKEILNVAKKDKVEKNKKSFHAIKQGNTQSDRSKNDKNKKQFDRSKNNNFSKKQNDKPYKVDSNKAVLNTKNNNETKKVETKEKLIPFAKLNVIKK